MRVSLDISRRGNRKRNTTKKKVELEGGIGQRNAWKRSRHDVTSEYDESRKVNVCNGGSISHGTTTVGGSYNSRAAENT